jgi:SAM-dependent methyltransferase
MAGGQARSEQRVEEVYDAIAEAWAKTRGAPWPEVRAFLGSVPRGTRVADVGTGSGRYLAVDEAAGLHMVGLDVSRALLALARVAAPRASLVRADGRALPLRTGSMGAATLVAVIHHLETAEERAAALLEARRVLAPGGRALFTAWGVEAEAFEGARRAPEGGLHDYLVPFRAPKAPPVERFFHAYEPGELEREVRQAAFAEAREWTDRANRFVEARA